MLTLYSKKILQPGLNLRVKNKVCHDDTFSNNQKGYDTYV